jgi:hypothetical protein
VPKSKLCNYTAPEVSFQVFLYDSIFVGSAGDAVFFFMVVISKLQMGCGWKTLYLE